MARIKDICKYLPGLRQAKDFNFEIEVGRIGWNTLLSTNVKHLSGYGVGFYKKHVSNVRLGPLCQVLTYYSSLAFSMQIAIMKFYVATLRVQFKGRWLRIRVSIDVPALELYVLLNLFFECRVSISSSDVV